MNLKASLISFSDFFRRIYSGPWYKKTAAWIATFFVIVIMFFVCVDCNFCYLFGRSPGFDDIKDPVVNEASEVYTCDEVLMGRYFNENRTPVTYEEISPILIRTLIDTEDERFYQHHGIDVIGLFSAGRDILFGRARGASTITQQLAKNLFRVRTQYSTGLLGRLPGIKILVMKAKEWNVALKLEWLFSKEDILTMYLNTVDFGSNAYGIKTAARTYFGTTPDKLTYEQAATLVGLLKATSYYNPRLNPQNSLQRRNTVLQLVYDHHHIFLNGMEASPAQFDSLLALPVALRTRTSESYQDGMAPYFREALKSYIDALCTQGFVPGYDAISKLDLDAGGLRIYTSIDSRMQAYAEAAVQKQMQVIQKRFNDHWGRINPWQNAHRQEISNFAEDIARRSPYGKYLDSKYQGNTDSINFYLHQPHLVRLFSYNGPIQQEMSTIDSVRYMLRFMHTGFVAIEPDTRFVRAWVGDIDFHSWQVDNVRAVHQPGSTFKLFVYTEAMNQGLNPIDHRLDSYVAYVDTIAGKPKVWAPHNADGYFTNREISLKSAFAMSINSVAVRVGMECGVHNIAKTAYAMGIKTKLQEMRSMVLGSSEVNLLELVNSYCTVANDGRYNMPLLVERIEDRDGNLIYQARKNEKKAIPYRSAFLMQRMLAGGLSGTSSGLWNYIRPFYADTEFGGKTGTSNNHADAWFVGVTPKLVGGAWVGGEYPSIHFRTGQLGQGSKTALPIFGEFIQSVLSDEHFSKYRVKFPPANGIDSRLWTGSSYSYHRPDTTTFDYDFSGSSSSSDASDDEQQQTYFEEEIPVQEEKGDEE
ncbi:MAG: penicillin-binding protein [Bacteroidaceae bacterium]|nr:penicillin-binding protein [Bacteroidaceae bacterium]